MATTELSNSKSICVLAVVVCCLGILWPKIFLPMFQSAISMTSDHTESTRDDVSLLPPKVREAMKLSRPQEFQRLAGRPFQRESKININDTPNKTTTGGVMGLLMPLYTIGIIVFFMYTILRMMFNKNSVESVAREEETPIINPDLQMDPEYKKYIFREEYDEKGKKIRNLDDIKRKAKFINKNLKESKRKKIKPIMKDFDCDRVSKALHVLIRDMEEFKTKLNEVEIYKNQTKQMDSTAEDAKLIINEEKEINEKSDKSDEENTENEENNDSSKENDDKKDSESDFENEITDETEDTYALDTNCDAEEDMRQELLKNLDSDVWQSLLKGMKHLERLKKEE